MKRSFLPQIQKLTWMFIGAALFFGACNGSTTEESAAENSGSNPTNTAISENEPVESMVQFFDKTISGSTLTVVDFYAEWCGPCKRMAPFVKELKEENSNINVMQIDAEANADIAGRYNIEGYPTIIFFKDGQIVDRVLGFMDKTTLEEYVNRLK